MTRTVKRIPPCIGVSLVLHACLLAFILHARPEIPPAPLRRGIALSLADQPGTSAPDGGGAGDSRPRLAALQNAEPAMRPPAAPGEKRPPAKPASRPAPTVQRPKPREAGAETGAGKREVATQSPPKDRPEGRNDASENTPAAPARPGNGSGEAAAGQSGVGVHPEAGANPKPPYPELARKRGQQGNVVLRVEVDADGDPTDVSVHASSGYALLDQAALRTVRKWKFAPARNGGRAVPGRVLVPVEFRLRITPE